MLDLGSVYYPLEACSWLLAQHSGEHGLRFIKVLQAQLLRAPSAPSISQAARLYILLHSGQPLQTSFPSPECYLAQINVLSTTDSAPGQISSAVIRVVHGRRKYPQS